MTYEIIDDTDPRLVYTGDWRQIQGPLDPKNPEYNGTIHATNDPAATISYYNFYGKVLDIFGSISAVDGTPNATFSITPNGVSPQRLNQYGYVATISEGVVSHMWLFKSGALPERHYNMTLTVDGVWPGGPTFYFDFLRVQNWVFNDAAAWKAVHQTGDYLYDTRQSPDAGGMSEITFYGTEVTLYGGLNGTYDALREIASFKVDDEAYQKVFVSNITDETEASTVVRNHKIFSTSGVKDIGTAPHTLTISVPPSTGTVAATLLPQTSPWLIDYIVFNPSSGAVSSTIGTQLSPSIASSPLDPFIPSDSPALTSITMIGIIVGSSIAGLAIILAILILWRKKSRYKAAAKLRAFPWAVARVPFSPASLFLPGNGKETPDPQKGASGEREEQMAEVGPSAPRRGALGAGRRKPFGGIGRARRETVDDSVHTLTQTGAADTVLEDEFPKREMVVREVDGGVRLTPGYDEGNARKVSVLPPSYSQYER